MSFQYGATNIFTERASLREKNIQPGPEHRNTRQESSNRPPKSSCRGPSPRGLELIARAPPRNAKKRAAPSRVSAGTETQIWDDAAAAAEDDTPPSNRPKFAASGTGAHLGAQRIASSGAGGGLRGADSCRRDSARPRLDQRRGAAREVVAGGRGAEGERGADGSRSEPGSRSRGAGGRPAGRRSRRRGRVCGEALGAASLGRECGAARPREAAGAPVTVADYGSQVLVSLVLNMEVTSGSFSMVAEEDSEDLRKDGADEILERITDLVNKTLAEDGSYNILLSKEAILSALDTGKSEGGPSGRHWVLDPIDGTKGFVRGGQYAIALALLDEGKVVLGVLGCPNLPLTSISNLSDSSSRDKTGALFSAAIGCGAEEQSLDGSPPQKISVCTIDNPVNASFFESYEGAHTMRDFTGSVAEKLGVQAPPIRIDSQAKYGAVARGDGAIYWRFPDEGYRETIWDHAAGSIVVTEAGGVVKDASGNDLDFSKGRFLDRDTGIIATNKQLMPSVLKSVQEAIKEKKQASSPL